MATFDPDAYLAKKPAFDPDAYLAQGQKPDGYEFPRAVGGAVRDFLAGGVRGAGSIGATLIRPFESAQENAERRAKMDQALANLVGADTDSMAYGGGKLVSEVAGTSGMGGAIARPVGALLGRVAPSTAPAVVQALRTGGMSTGASPVGMAGRAGDLALRSGAGATVGYASDRAVGGDGSMGALFGGGLPLAGKVADAAGFLGKKFLGGTTGVGDKAIDIAYQTGKSGGAAGQAFRDNMRGNVPMDDVLGAAKSAVAQMRMDRSNQYRQGMAGVSADKSVIDFAPIDSAINSLRSMGNYKGQVINKNASGTVDEIVDLVGQWKSLDPAQFHTPEGLDALKQAIGDIRDATQFGTPARRAADTAYNAVKGQVTKQAPTYANVMKDYSEASDLLKEIDRALGTGEKTAADTAMRKLQSLMRNNVNTNYGYRDDLARQLEQRGGVDLLSSLAGQAVNDWVPRGLQRAAAGTGGAGLALTGNLPAAAGLAAVSSPRLVGEAAHLAGRLNPANNALVRQLKQGAYYGAPVMAAQD